MPAPRLLDSFECGDWFVLVIEAVRGRMPVTPWRTEDLDRVLAGLDALRATATDVLTGILGFFVDAARWEIDPSLPTVQAHRIARRDAMMPLVRGRRRAEGRR